jgi:peptidylprolyl isomerase
MATHQESLRLLSLALCLALCGLSSGAEEPEADAFEPPADLDEGWYARIETSKGRVVARLLPEQAPQAVAHFAGLAQATLPWTNMITGEIMTTHYYDGMLIHTVVAGRLFETGDAGSIGGVMPLLYVPDEGFGPLDFSRSYMMGMTRMGGGRISAVKFFVTAAGQPWLSGQNPCFGQVVEGKEVVFNISQVRSYSNRRPIEDIFIEKIRIFKVGDPPPLPEPVPFKPTRKKLELRKSDP